MKLVLYLPMGTDRLGHFLCGEFAGTYIEALFQFGGFSAQHAERVYPADCLALRPKRGIDMARRRQNLADLGNNLATRVR